MVASSVRLCDWFELLVILFQVFGVGALCLSRFFPGSRWAERGRAGFVIALVGLGIAGALCGRHDSEFGLFAGGTMTALLIGMTMGSGQPDTTSPVGLPAAPEPKLAA